ncbi:hypothetical protein MRBLMI12_003835 [Microbacterium sp. LMI12-1-1.1]|uniref:hypothetical protein n=1 Tax=Microbacterium sp. LMI12-1-1.1 TaxID=3135225 RepID=UPI003433D40E
MTQNPTPETTGSTEPRPAVEVDVARTGGIAGITRRWSAQPPETEAPEWISLIDRCPWNEAHPPADATGADVPDDADTAVAPDTAVAERIGPDGRDAPDAAVAQRIGVPVSPHDAQAAPAEPRSPMPDSFVWFIRASWSGTDPREAELYDDEVVGAWRELVDAVREWSRSGASAGPERPGR